MPECKDAPTPALKSKKESPEDFEELVDADKEIYRRCVGILLYIAHDRHDAQWSIGELAKYIKTPTMGALKKLKRLARYLKGHKKYGTWIDSKGSLDDVVAWVDSDWAGDLQSRRSTTSVLITVGGSTIYSGSKRQHTTALSSGEAEYYAASQGAADLMHVAELLKFVGANPQPKLRSDSTACLGMASRSGVGRVRHLETRALWLQEQLQKEKFVMEKCGTIDNLSDIGTKALDEKRHHYLVKMIGMADLDTYHSEGRVASIQHSLGGHLAGGSNIAVLTALGLLLQAIGAAGKEDFDDEDVDAWWPIKVLIFTFILGAMAGSYMTWRIMSGRQTAVATAAAAAAASRPTTTAKSIITQTVCTYTWWTSNPRFKINCEGLDGAWHG
jgi:hypothetical protein